MNLALAGRKAQRTIMIPEQLDIELKKLAAELKLDKSDLYEAGAVLVLAIREEGRIPAELARRARQLSPRAADILATVVLGSRNNGRVGDRGNKDQTYSSG